MVIQISPQQILEERSRRKFKCKLPDEWIIIDINPDYGLDMDITIAEKGIVTTEVVAIQVKASGTIKNTRNGFTYPLETKHLKYYENYLLPVFVFCYVKADSSFHYLFVQKYLKENLNLSRPNWRKNVKISVPFSTDCKLRSITTLRSRISDSVFYMKQYFVNIDPSKPVYTLDGIPKSSNKELKKRMLTALEFVETNKFREAIDEFDAILKICTMRPIQKVVILNGLGNAQQSLSKFNEALKSYKAIITLANRMDNPEMREGLAVAWGNLAIIYKTKGELSKAVKYSKLALTLQRELKNREAEASILNNLAIIYRTRRWTQKAKAQLESALTINRAIGNRRGEANNFSNMGNIYQMRGDPDEALKIYRLSLRIDKEIGNHYGEANNLGSIGIVYAKQNKSVKAMKYFGLALNIHKQIGNREGEATSLCNIASVYFDKKDSNNALKNNQLALDIYKEIGDIEGEATALGTMGNIYLMKEKPYKALKYYKEALKLFETIGATDGINQTKKIILSLQQMLYRRRTKNPTMSIDNIGLFI